MIQTNYIIRYKCNNKNFYIIQIDLLKKIVIIINNMEMITINIQEIIKIYKINIIFL